MPKNPGTMAERIAATHAGAMQTSSALGRRFVSMRFPASIARTIPTAASMRRMRSRSSTTTRKPAAVQAATRQNVARHSTAAALFHARSPTGWTSRGTKPTATAARTTPETSEPATRPSVATENAYGKNLKHIHSQRFLRDLSCNVITALSLSRNAIKPLRMPNLTNSRRAKQHQSLCQICDAFARIESSVPSLFLFLHQMPTF